MKSGGEIVQIFPETDCRSGHRGLGDMASKGGVILSKLKPGQYVVFFNRKRTQIKIAAANNVIAHRKSEEGRFYDVGCIRDVVRAFHNNGIIDYDAALKKKLVDILKIKQ